MVLRRSLLQRILTNPKITPQLPPPASLRPRNNTSTSIISPRSRLPLPVGDDLIEKLRGLRTVERVPSYPAPVSTDRRKNNTIDINNNSEKKKKNMKLSNDEIVVQFSVDDARKCLHVTKLESVKTTLRDLQQPFISHSDFLKICSGGSSGEDGIHIAKSLDESGAVIVLGNIVFLRPKEVASQISTLISYTGGGRINHGIDGGKEDDMKKRECLIEKKATDAVRKELWLGLGFITVQTVGFMRLTFWELSWDVMEPICFYVTSFYFMGGYYFFMKTSREPTFQEIFKARLHAKKRKLMKADSLDADRFRQLSGGLNERS